MQDNKTYEMRECKTYTAVCGITAAVICGFGFVLILLIAEHSSNYRVLSVAIHNVGSDSKHVAIHFGCNANGSTMPPVLPIKTLNSGKTVYFGTADLDRYVDTCSIDVIDKNDGAILYSGDVIKVYGDKFIWEPKDPSIITIGGVHSNSPPVEKNHF